ncbi:integrase [Sinorhizobium fredii]
MSSKLLTSDNLLLSRPKNGSTDTAFESSMGNASVTAGGEVNFTNLPHGVAAYVANSLSENSRRAYAADLSHFGAWGGEVPANDITVARYLADHADTLTVSTLARRLASLSKVHMAKGLPNPTNAELVKATMRGIKRQHGTARAEAKPLLRDDLFMLLEKTPDNLRGARDRALLLVGFAGGFRRSELVALNFEDVDYVKQGVVLALRKSKTDQTGAGRKIAIPFGRSRWCPVYALDKWLNQSGIAAGPLFRPVNKHGCCLDRRLSGEAVSLIIKEHLSTAGIDPTLYSGHSLRSGFATSAAMAGVSTWKIRQQTGHASDAMLSRYVRDGELFVNNAASFLV